MLLILVPVVVVAAGLAWAAGARRGALAAGGAVLGVLVLGALLGGIIGARDDGSDDEDTEGDPPEAAAAAPAAEPSSAADDRGGSGGGGGDGGGSGGGDGGGGGRDPGGRGPSLREPDVVLAPPGDPFAPPAVLDGLDDGAVLLVEVATEGGVALHQCHAGRSASTGCAPGIAANGVDDAPAALVELRAEITTPSGPVDCTEQECVLAAIADGDLVVEAPLVFGGRAQTVPEVGVSPASGLAAGQDVSVRISGMAPGSTGFVAFCTAAEDAAHARCRSGDATAFEADGDGQAAATLRLGGCPRTDRCAIRVRVAGASPAFQPVAFADPPGPDLGGGRVALGVGVAAALLLGAYLLVRRGDWEPPDGDPFAGIDLAGVDPFAGIDLDEPEEDDAWGPARR